LIFLSTTGSSATGPKLFIAKPCFGQKWHGAWRNPGLVRLYWIGTKQ
jgi:hypothetical protein